MALATEPPLTDRQRLAMRAFQDLAGERPVASEYMGPMYWRAIAAWCDRYGVPDAESFIELVQVIDRDYLNAASPKNSHGKNPGHRKGAQGH